MPRWTLSGLGWCATGLLLLRSGASIIQIIYFVAAGRLNMLLEPLTLWELWFYLGTVLFCLSFRRFRHIRERSISPAMLG